MKDFPISKRLLITFGAILAMFFVTVIIAVFSLLSTGGNFDTFYEGPYEVTNTSSDLRGSIQAMAKNIGYSMMENDKAKTAEYIESAKDELQKLREGTEFLTQNFKGDMSLLEGYDSTMRSIIEDRDKVFEYALENKNEEATELYFSSVMPVFKQANDYLLKIDEDVRKRAASTYNSASTQKTVVTIILLVISVLTFGITVAMARYISRSITKPLNEIEQAAKEMADGSLSAEITYESKDEMGSLANSMRDLTSGFSLIIEDIGNILGALAKGNFHITSRCLENYKGDFTPILTAMRLIRDNLNETLLQINESTQQVAVGAAQMAENAQGLAEGATEQAGAVQQLTATVEDVANVAENSADSAQKAYRQVEKSAEKAENSKEDMEDLIKAMERINETSKEIENIIADIEEIASQTNMLSLNASIEAARAGEAGRGFAVVANQIGKLASDSAQSAVNTKELIAKTLEEIETGNNITVKTSEAFRNVIEEMRGFAEVSRETSSSSMSQFESLKEIKKGIEQISSVVQSNSAAAEETSATSEELSAQAESLEQQVNKFQLLT